MAASDGVAMSNSSLFHGELHARQIKIIDIM